MSPRDRIAAWLGEEHVDGALIGLRATLARDDLPIFDDVMALAAERRRYGWWHALVAGLNERWTIEPGFDGLSDDFLRGLLVFDLTNPVWGTRDGSERQLVHPWREAILAARPELARDAYLAVARARLSRADPMIDGLHELLTETALEPFRTEVAIGLLRDFPNANDFRLGEILDAVTRSSDAHREFLTLAESVLSGTVAIDARQRDLWLATAYLLSPSRFERDVEASARARPSLVFDLRDRSGFAFRALPAEGVLSVQQLEFMAGLTGRLFPETPHPSGGWGGDTNAWDASNISACSSICCPPRQRKPRR